MQSPSFLGSTTHDNEQKQKKKTNLIEPRAPEPKVSFIHFFF